MGELESEQDTLQHFTASGRAGRRNALPVIEVEINDPGALKLAERLSDMTAHCENEQDVRRRQEAQNSNTQHSASS
ncbi:unnamed protein product [Auanema sp. JU1783]|nr:unnamed protein product [Auanema sp. JU1783]